MRAQARANLTLALFLLLSALVAAPCARAHEFRLALSRQSAHMATVEVRAGVGEGLATEWRPFDPARAVRFVARMSRTHDLKALAVRGDSVWARRSALEPGGTMLAYESDFAHITLESAAFDAYLAEDGLDAVLAKRRASEPGPGRERFRRCAKAWLAGTDRTRAIEPIGLPLELVPLAIPGESRSLALRLLFEGRPLEGALVRAWRRPVTGAAPEAPAWSSRTDARGEVEIPGLRAGEWLVGTVHMVPSRDRQAADWESTWASLVFEQPVGQ